MVAMTAPMLAPPNEAGIDTGPRDVLRGRQRLCVATRTVKHTGEMIRFVIGPDRTVVPDLKRKLPGRGVWVTASRAALSQAVGRQAFARAFRCECRASSSLVELAEQLIERSALDALGIVHKAGTIAIGFANVEAALAAGLAVGLLHAADAGDDGVRKVAAAARRHFGENTGRIPVVDAFTSAQLDLALGRSNVVHAALLAGYASERFLARCASLERFRAVDPSGQA